MFWVGVMVAWSGCAAREPSKSSDGGLVAEDRGGEARAVDSARGDLGAARDAQSLCKPWEWEYQGHCYVAVGLEWMDYATARLLCVESGGEPASITSAGENELILKLLPRFAGECWVGLKRTGNSPTDFVWESGEKLSYANWAPDEPDNADGSEACGSLLGPVFPAEQRGKWIDQPCDWYKRDTIVCERDPRAVIVP